MRKQRMVVVGGTRYQVSRKVEKALKRMLELFGRDERLARIVRSNETAAVYNPGPGGIFGIFDGADPVPADARNRHGEGLS